MRNEPHSFISAVRATIDQWRSANRWSREAVVQRIVDAHVRIGADKVTGIEFSAHSDTFARTKVDAERFYRWLDDVTKDSTLLPMNMLPSILEALPMDLRQHVLTELARPRGMEVHCAECVEPADFDSRSHLSAVAKEGTEAVIALGQLDQNASPAEIENVVRECIEAENAASKAVRGARALLAKAKSTLRRAA
jgi:hypothetical protein